MTNLLCLYQDYQNENFFLPERLTLKEIPENRSNVYGLLTSVAKPETHPLHAAPR